MPIDEPEQNLNVLFRSSVVAEIDAHAEQMQARSEAHRVTRSDALRDLVLRGLREAKRSR